MLKPIKEYYAAGFYHHYFVDENGLEQGDYKVINPNGEIHTSGFLKDGFYNGIMKCHLTEKNSWIKTVKNRVSHGVFINLYC